MTEWVTGTCKTNNIDIHYIRTGGSKPPLVLLHGLMTSGACFIPIAKALEKEYDIIMPDARGHGNSSAPNRGYRYEDLAADVLNFMDELKLDMPVLLGHSMGGMTAALVASLNSKNLKALILADPTFLTRQRQQEVYESDVIDQHRKILKRPQSEYLAEVRSRSSKRSKETIELFAKARLQTSIHAFGILKPPNPNYMELIKTIDIPTLLIIGDEGAVVSPDMAIEFANLNAYFTFVQIAQAGHAVPFDQPEQFSAVVQTFLRVLNAPS